MCVTCYCFVVALLLCNWFFRVIWNEVLREIFHACSKELAAGLSQHIQEQPALHVMQLLLSSLRRDRIEGAEVGGVSCLPQQQTEIAHRFSNFIFSILCLAHCGDSQTLTLTASRKILLLICRRLLCICNSIDFRCFLKLVPVQKREKINLLLFRIIEQFWLEGTFKGEVMQPPAMGRRIFN